MKNFFFYIIVLLLFRSPALLSQTENSSSELGFRFHSAQLEVTTAVFIFTAGGYADFDVYGDGQYGTFGLRAGCVESWKGDVGGPVSGSPFFDYDVLSRATFAKGFLRVDLCGGLTYHTASKSYFDIPEGAFAKFTIDVKARIYRDFAGVLLKVGISKQSYGGIGIYIGYGK